MDPEPVKSVSLTLRYPVHSDLTRDQLAYYTYWKSTIGTRSFKKTADGYCWLLVCELINSKDREKASATLNSMVAPASRDGSPVYPELIGTAIEFSNVFGTPMPGFHPWLQNEDFTLGYILDSPVSDIPVKTLTDYAGIEIDVGVCKILGTVLRKYDEVLRTKNNSSVREILMEPERRSYLPFSGYVLLGKKVPVETIEWSLKEDLFADLVKIIIGRLTGTDTAAISFPLAEDLATIIDAARSGNARTESPDPFSKNGNCFRVLGSEPTEMGPSCFDDPLSPDRTGSRITLGDVLTFSPAKTPVKAEFATSGLVHPTYNDLSRNQFGYYNYWKNSFVNGAYLDTDCGYLNLFITELINSGDHRKSHELLEKLMRIYGRVGLIPVTLTDHALCNGLPLPDPHTYTDRLTVNTWIESFVMGTNRTPLDKQILGIMRSGSPNVRFEGADIPLRPLELALRRIFEAISCKKDIHEILSAEPISSKRSIYVGLDYFRGPKECAVKAYNYIGSRKFINLVDKIVRYAAEVCGTHAKGDSSRKKPFVFGGVNCASIIYEEFLVFLATSQRPAEVRLELDMDAVRTAQSDLAQVTEMMKVEEEPEPEAIIEAAEQKPSAGGPWPDLMGSLTPSEKEYLRLCIGGLPTSEFLRNGGTTKVKMEDGINNKALDTVGDTVIEDGQPVEDYLEELEKGL